MLYWNGTGLRPLISGVCIATGLIIPLTETTGIERDILFVSLSPGEIYERKVTYEQIYTAITSLPAKQAKQAKQAKRIYAHYFLGMSQATIARAEGVSKKAICSSIMRGLKRLEYLLKNLLD